MGGPFYQKAHFYNITVNQGTQIYVPCKKNVHSYCKKKQSLSKEEQFGAEVDHLTHSLVAVLFTLHVYI